jgi:hypothetical protein
MRCPSAFRAFALSLVPLVLGGCAIVPSWAGGGNIPKALEPAKVPEAIKTAEHDLEKGRTEQALERMRAASLAKDLEPELRDQVQRVLEKAAEKRIAELSAPGSDPDALADLLDLDLPRQIAVTAGLRAARMELEAGHGTDAFELVKKIDKKFPLHHERIASGDLLADIGFSLLTARTGWFGWFSGRDDAQEVLEYLILNAPWCSRCDQAYWKLADLYEEDRRWSLGIERLEQLVLNHPTSPLRPAAQARIPRLRIASIESPEYDRAALIRARGELETWLRGYAGHELEHSVRLALAECLTRLAENDLTVAGFYARVGSPGGVRHHATRAVEEATSAGDASRVARAEKLLADWPAPQTEPAAPTGDAGTR